MHLRRPASIDTDSRRSHGSVHNHSAAVPLSRFVYFSTMPDSENQDEQSVVVDFVDDPVVACSHAPFTGASDELNRFGRARISCQEFDCGVYSAPDLWVEFAKLSFGGRSDRHRISHTRPRSALTCSHGVGSACVRRISSRDSSAARISAMSSANSISRSKSSASMTAATRRPRRERNTGSWSV